MRIALCLSGYFRGFASCISTWKEYLLRKNMDVFLVSGKTREWNTGENIERELSILKNETNLINFKLVEPIPDPGSKLFNDRNFNQRNVSGFLSMLHKIKMVNQLKNNYEDKRNFKYDCVLRFRPDIYLRSPLIINEKQDMNKWHLPRFGDYGGLNDQICWSSSKNMDNYAKMYDEVKEYLLGGRSRTLFHEGQLLDKWKKSGCKIERHSILYQFARTEEYLEKDNETREREDGFIK